MCWRSTVERSQTVSGMENPSPHTIAGTPTGGPEKISWTTSKGALPKPSDTFEATLTPRMEQYFTLRSFPNLASAALPDMRFLTNDSDLHLQATIVISPLYSPLYSMTVSQRSVDGRSCIFTSLLESRLLNHKSLPTAAL